MAGFRLDFLGIGAQKCATTWLAFRLNDHPDIFIPPEKEIHFWDSHFEKGLEAYRSFFKANEGQSAFQGEFTPAYAILPLDRIRAIQALSPSIRLIYSIRNPIDRAWSAALMGLRDCGMELEEASDQWFIDHFHSKGSLLRGDYAQCLSNWLSVFSPSQFLVLDYDALSSHPLEALNACCLHLGVDPDPLNQIPKETIKTKVFEGGNPPIRQSLKSPLESLYRDRIRNTECLLASLPREVYWQGPKAD